MQEFNPNYYLRQQLEYAEEQLMIADDITSKLMWGNRCDALEAAMRDLSEWLIELYFCLFLYRWLAC